MGCVAEDSIEHYAFRAAFHGYCERLVNLGAPPAEERLASFIGLGGAAPEAAALRAITVHALYGMHNAARYGGRCSEERFRGFLMEAVRGHGRAMSLLAGAFRRPRVEA